MDAHRLAEARSIALHEAIAAKLRVEPSVLERARQRVAGWLRDGTVHPHYAQRWAAVLAADVEVVCAALVDPGEEMTALRQCTPFAGVIDPRVRWRIWREVRARMERAA